MVEPHWGWHTEGSVQCDSACGVLLSATLRGHPSHVTEMAVQPIPSARPTTFHPSAGKERSWRQRVKLDHSCGSTQRILTTISRWLSVIWG